MLEQDRRVYSHDGASPTVRTKTGGSKETIITEPTSAALRTRTYNGSYNYAVDCRIRKLTPKECGRLMGVKDDDIERLTARQSKTGKYHLFGDSIVTTCLMAIFGELCGADYEAKIDELAEEIKEKE